MNLQPPDRWSTLLLATFVLALCSGCWLFRDTDECSVDADCRQGEACFDNAGIHVCVPSEFLDSLDGGASDTDGDIDEVGAPDATEDGAADALLDDATDQAGGDPDDDAPQDAANDEGEAEDLADDLADDGDPPHDTVPDGLSDDANDSDTPPDGPIDDAATETEPCDGGEVNACGGCLELAEAPGDPCGPCLLDEVVCDTSDSTGNGVICDGTTAGNPCGGCDTLDNPPGDACGPCGSDRYECDPADLTGNSTRCDGATFDNACDGCGALAHEPGDPCGPCGLDQYACNGSEAVACNGSTTNDCGGCSELPGMPGEVCSCGGLGDAVWSCDGVDALTCADDNDTFDTAEFLGNVDEDDELTFVRWIDGTDDVDVYRFDVTQDIESATINPGVSLTRLPEPGSDYAISYLDGLLWFYRYNDSRGANIVPYACGTLNECVVFDTSSATIEGPSGACSIGSGSFDPTQDLYGCRGLGPATDHPFGPPFDLGGGAGMANIDDNDEGNPDDRGVSYLLVYTSTNEAPDGCEEYTLDVHF